jgi:hypothetical protein
MIVQYSLNASINIKFTINKSRKATFITTGLLVILFLFSCSKDSDPTPEPITKEDIMVVV